MQLLKPLVGGLQRNGTLRSSTIKKVAPPVVPDVVGGGTAGRRHSSASPTSSASLYGALPGTPDPRASLQGSPGFALPGNAVDNASQPPPSPSPGYDSTEPTTFCPGEPFTESQMAPLTRPQSHPGTPVGTPTTPLPPGLPPTGRGCYIVAGSLDDPGCGVTTPGRDSPSGGSVESRHSSSSLDSGRGSSSSSSADSKVAHRLSTGSHGSSGSLTLTSSVGSHMSSLTPEVVVLSPLNVAGLLVNGVSGCVICAKLTAAFSRLMKEDVEGGPEEKMSADRLSYPDWPREDDLNPFSPYFLPLDRRSHSWVDLCGGTSQGVLCHPSVRRHDDDSVSHKGERISRRKSTVGVFRKGLRLLRRSFSAENGFKLGMAPLTRPQSHPGTPVGTPTTPLPPGLPPTGRGCYIVAGSLDDPGCGVTTPGRDSPSGGSVESRHSSSSLDSGRGSSSSSSADSKVAHRLSTGSHGSSGSLTLTSSVGSHMSSLTPEVVVLSPLNVAGLLVNGVSDTEVLTTWLKNLHFEEYVHLFLQAGYDMPTISRMTPEDLTAIGITKPAHRRKLKSEISNLNIPDGIPDYKPDTLLTWLKLLRLEQYYGSLCQQGYHTVDRAADLTWEDLEDIGMQKLGHQKKMMLAIKKIRDLNSGLRRSGNYGDIRHSSIDMGQVLSQRTTAQGLIPLGHPYHHAVPPPPPAQEAPPPHANAVPLSRPEGDPAPQLRTFRQQSPPRFHRAGSGESLLQGQPHFGGPLYQHQGALGASDLYQHDFLAMQVRSPNRGRSLESLEDGGTAYQGGHPPGQYQYQGSYQQQQGYPQQGPSPDWYQMVSSWRQHGYDTDSELVRQVSHHGYDYGYEPDGTATLHRPRGLVKPRPVAKVTARALLDSPDLEFEPKEADPKLGSDWESGKRCAPAPPKRTNSIRRQQEANMAETAFATCVQSLTSRFTMATSQDEPPLPPPPPAAAEEDEPPPPPLPAPPPASSSSTLTSSSSSTSSDGELSPSGTLIRRKDSGGSSVSSESLPFANENVGTIKQRPGEAPPAPPPHGGGCVADGAERRSSPTDGCRSSPEEVPVRDVPQDLRPVASRDKYSAPQQRPAIPPRPTDKLSGAPSALGRSLPPLPPPSSSSSGDVIDDIEHMLASLTDQLDAMLECELSNP
ncbi:caskin-1 [Ixodes scapularis]